MHFVVCRCVSRDSAKCMKYTVCSGAYGAVQQAVHQLSEQACKLILIITYSMDLP
jgi:hypothetical protein